MRSARKPEYASYAASSVMTPTNARKPKNTIPAAAVKITTDRNPRNHRPDRTCHLLPFLVISGMKPATRARVPNATWTITFAVWGIESWMSDAPADMFRDTRGAGRSCRELHSCNSPCEGAPREGLSRVSRRAHCRHVDGADRHDQPRAFVRRPR